MITHTLGVTVLGNTGMFSPTISETIIGKQKKPKPPKKKPSSGVDWGKGGDPTEPGGPAGPGGIMIYGDGEVAVEPYTGSLQRLRGMRRGWL